jgi:Mn2+/Fe2+ NRAMP family transporter
MPEEKILPPAPKLRSLLGPSFLILAMGLGSGEIILWPYLVSNYGLGLAWAGVLGISLQFFINLEIERYALVTGESVFSGFNKLWHWMPFWFIFSTFIGFGLPGIIASSAFIFKSLFQLSLSSAIIGAILLLIIGLILSVGKTVYSLMEKLTTVFISFGVFVILLLVIYFSRAADYHALLAGLSGQGHGYAFLPIGIALATFFSAFVYSGAGGNLNLTQSIYIREKGYGLGCFSAKMAGLFRRHDSQQKISVIGNVLAKTEDNKKLFKKWWRLINIEHAIVFWLIGSLTILMLMLLSYVLLYGHGLPTSGISFVLNEGLVIGKSSLIIIGQLFLLVAALMLAQTQLSVFDSVSRIIAENIAIIKSNKNKTNINLAKYYYLALWLLIVFGIILFICGASEPKFLLVLAGVINGLCMAVHVLLTYVLNKRKIPDFCKPAWWRQAIVIVSFIIYLSFAIFSIYQAIK